MFSSLLISHRILPLIIKYGNPDGWGGTFTHVPLSHGNLPLIKKSGDPDGGDIHPCPPPLWVRAWSRVSLTHHLDDVYRLSPGRSMHVSNAIDENDACE